ncbi:hypothetical protein ACFXPE_19200 [Streptomyces scopuliridis]
MSDGYPGPGLLERASANALANVRAWSPLGTAVRVHAVSVLLAG